MAKQDLPNLRVFVSRAGEMAEYPAGTSFVQATLHAIRQAKCVGDEMQDFTASPEPSAQLCIDSVKQCDIYVALLGMKWGSQVRDRDDEISYTQLEFETAREAGIPCLVFLLDEKAELPADAMIDFAHLENMAKQQSFRKLVKESGITCKAFKSADELQRIVKDGVINERDKLAGAEGGPSMARSPSTIEPTFPSEYRQWLQKECSDIGLLGMKRKEGQAIRLSNVYVPLTTIKRSANERDDAHVAEQDDESNLRLPGETEPPAMLLELLGEESLYASGDAGTGKSTFCRWVALLLAIDEYPPHEVNPPDNFQETFPDSFRGRLPLLVPLRQFWEFLPRSAGKRHLSANELQQSLTQWLNKSAIPGLDWPNVKAHLDRGSLLLILDGADEVPGSDDDLDACSPHQMLIDGIAHAKQAWHEDNRLLLTSRPYGLDDDDVARLDLPHYQIGDLPDDLQSLLVDRWFTILKGDVQQGSETSREMFNELSNQPERQAITANPLLLTAACIVFGDGGGLPQDKHDLYDRIVECVLKNRFPKDPRILELVENELAVVAFGMHTGEGSDPPDQLRDGPTAEASNDELDKWLRQYHDTHGMTHAEFKTVVDARERLLSQTGLLLPRPNDKAAFYHLSFQEFFAARRLIQSEETSALADVFCRRAANARWHNTLTFLFGAILHASNEKGAKLLDQLIQRISVDSQVNLDVVVGDCLLMLLRKGWNLSSQREQQFREICLAAIDNEIPVPKRAKLAAVLGDLGDPRVVADLRDHAAVDGLGRPAYIKIPADTYHLGDKRNPWELKQPIWMTRMPVTNGQYRLFWNPDDEDGYHKREWWSDEGWTWLQENNVKEPGYWHDPKWNGSNQPVVRVSFWEAQAFATWAGAQLPKGEWWQAAAGGPAGSEYAWDGEWEDRICNSSEAELGRTSPVGIFPRSRSAAFGFDDMAGNVWEWCDELFDDRASYRVMRGGSWSNSAENCRVASRYRDDPGNRNSVIGFRLALVQSALSSSQQVAEPDT